MMMMMIIKTMTLSSYYRQSRGHLKQLNPRSSEGKTYPELFNRVISQTIRGRTVTQFSHRRQKQQASAPICIFYNT